MIEHNKIRLSSDGKSVIVPIDVWSSILEELGHYNADEETAEILADREIMAAIRKSEEDIKKGRLVSLEDIEKQI